MSSSNSYQLTNLPLLLTISQHRFANCSSCFLYLIRSCLVCTLMHSLCRLSSIIIILTLSYVLDLLVFVSFTYHFASTSNLSTLSSRKGSYSFKMMGSLILRRVACLDAFSTSPCHTWLPSYAPGGTTGTPVLCPSRSSRTKDSSSHTADAHDG